MIGYRAVRAAATAVLACLLVACAAAEPASIRPSLPPWAWEMPQCVGYRPAELAAPEHRQSVHVAHLPGLTERVERYETGWGIRAVAEIRAVVRACGSYEYGEYGDPAGYLAQNRVLETGFAGDESLLVETVHLIPPATRTWYAAVVRHGDRVTTIRTSGRSAAQTRCLVVAESATCA